MNKVIQNPKQVSIEGIIEKTICAKRNPGMKEVLLFDVKSKEGSICDVILPGIDPY